MSETHQVESVSCQSTGTSSNVQNPSEFASNTSTPAKKKVGSNLAYTSIPQDTDVVRDQLSNEMEGRWVGAMPVQDFLDTFLPTTSTSKSLPDVPKTLFQSVPSKGPDSGRYEPFIKEAKAWMPHLEAVNTSSREDTVNGLKLKPDVSVYDRANPVQKGTDFSRMELWMEFKSQDGGAFCDIPADFEKDSRQQAIEQSWFTPKTKDGKFIRGQLAHYAGAMHSMQFRNFSFSVLVELHHARFIRWDPSGAVVTAAFDYREQPQLMADFLWRFDHLSTKERGHDTTVKPADLKDDVAARVREALGIKNSVPLFRYELHGIPESGYAYGPKLTTPNLSLVSRCTRNQPVVWIPAAGDEGKEGPWCKEKKIYMKDTWRFLSISSKCAEPEHEIYKELYAHNVPNIPQNVIGADIPDGKTRTQDFMKEKWLCVAQLEISPYQHYRLFLPVVGRPLCEFGCTKELVTGVSHALGAHSHAYEDAGILHRDISAGNVILTDEGGLLIDWELAKKMSDKESRRPDRTGTWQFMSAKLLQDPEKHHELSDDLESFLHVLAWITLRYLPAVDTYAANNRDHDLTMFDEVCPNQGRFESGGRIKALALGMGVYPSEKFRPRISTPLLGLLENLRMPFQSLYGQASRAPLLKLLEALNLPSESSNRISPSITNNVAGQEKLDNALSLLNQAYDQGQKRLENHDYFLETTRRALDEVWPVDDKADKYLPGSFTKTQKPGLGTTQQRGSHLVDSKALSSRGSKRASDAGPTAEPGPKRLRTPAASETRGGSS